MFLKKRKTINKEIGSSYNLKHIVENFGRCLYHNKIKLNGIGYETYISNGAFIQAMKNLDYCYSVLPGSINPYFNAQYNGPYKVKDYDNSRFADKTIPYHSEDWESFLNPLLSVIDTIKEDE